MSDEPALQWNDTFYSDDLAALEEILTTESLLMETPPDRIADILERPNAVIVRSLGHHLQRLRTPENHSKWMTVVSDVARDDPGQAVSRRIFILSGGPCLERAKAIWDWQLEVVGYDFHISIGAVANNGRPVLPVQPGAACGGQAAGTWPLQCRRISCEGLFDPSGLPGRTVQRPRDDGGFDLVIESGPSDDPNMSFLAALADVTSWCHAYMCLTGIGIRIRDTQIVPVCRRPQLGGLRWGPEEMLAPQASSAEIGRIASAASSDERLSRALEGLNASLCEASPGSRLVTLWCTVEALFAQIGDPPAGLDTHTGAERKGAPRRPRRATKNETIADAIAPYVPHVAPEDLLGFVQRCARSRHVHAHTLDTAPDLEFAVFELQCAIARFVGARIDAA